MRKEYFIGRFKVTEGEFKDYLERCKDDKSVLKVAVSKRKLHRDFLQYMFDEHFIICCIFIAIFSWFVGTAIAPFVIYLTTGIKA